MNKYFQYIVVFIMLIFGAITGINSFDEYKNRSSTEAFKELKTKIEKLEAKIDDLSVRRPRGSIGSEPE